MANYNGKVRNAMKMHTKQFCCKWPIKISSQNREKVRAYLEADVKEGVLELEHVLEGEPDNWCFRIVIQPKTSGMARHTVDSCNT